MSLFFPTVYRRRITDVTVEDLQCLGASCVLLDVDNTLTTHDAPELDARVSAWLDEMRQQFTLVIVSNNSAERVAPFAAKIGFSRGSAQAASRWLLGSRCRASNGG